MKYDMSSMLIMVIDDSAFMRHIVCQVLRKLEVGCVLEAESGSEALNQLALGQPDAIFCDWVMQPVTGIELLRMIRGRRTPIDAKTPLIMMTSQLEPAQVMEARDAGVSGYLAKPVTVKAILNQLSIVLKMPDLGFDAKPSEAQRQINGLKRA